MELPNSSVKVVQVCRVAPSLPASPDSPLLNFSLPLTFFDIRWLRFSPSQNLFFYEIPSPTSNDSLYSFDSILEKLKTSLSLTLQHFLPLVGNLTWPQDSLKPIVNYAQGDTLSLAIVESNADFDRLSSNYELLAAQEYHPLVPQLETSHERTAVMALQITLFPNRGFSIGTTVHHAVLDGLTLTSFFKSWAHICKHQDVTSSSLPDQLKPFYDRTVVEDQAGLGELFSNQYQDIDGPNNRSVMVWRELQAPQGIRGTFELTHASIQKLRRHVLSTVSNSNTIFHLSTFSLACAYTWVCMVKAEETKEDVTRLVFSANCRSRLEPPIPATYFGNCITGCLAVAETKAMLGGGGLVVALTAITEAMKRLNEGVLNGSEDWVSRLRSVRSGRITRMISIAGSQHFCRYETDFGYGRPNKVDLVSTDRIGSVYISDTKNGGGGLDIGLVLKKSYMDAFASLFAKGLKAIQAFEAKLHV